MLLNIKGLSEAKISKMVDACKQMTPSSTWRCATEVAEEVRSCTHSCRACLLVNFSLHTPLCVI